jgi:steroid delta-isomerase-like uncharacterized protein
VAQWIAEDVVYEDVGMGEVMKGRAEFMSFAKRTAEVSADYWCDIVSGADAGDSFMYEWVISGTHTGNTPELATAVGSSIDLTTPATSKPFRIRGVSVGRRNSDGKIAEDRDYWNVAELIRQLGVLPQTD